MRVKVVVEQRLDLHVDVRLRGNHENTSMCLLLIKETCKHINVFDVNLRDL